MKNSSSHVTSSTGRFFHLTRYSVIARFLSFLILVSRIVYGSSVIFPSPLIYDKIVCIGILSLIVFFKQETWKNGCTLLGGRWIPWRWSWAGGRPLGISPNTLDWLLITFWRSIGENTIYVCTSSEHNCAIIPWCPFLSNFFMLLKLITLEGFPWLPLRSI